MNERSDSYIIGDCDLMCPLSEAEMRKKNKLVHFYECEHKVLIKEFSRSAADKRCSEPCDLRTFGALKKTLDFLFNKLV